MLPLGTPAPEFSLPDPSGRVWTYPDVGEGRPCVVVFLSNHCPYVRHIAPVLGTVARELTAAGAGVVGIMSNDIDRYPDDAPEHMAVCARDWDWEFPYLVDEDQSVAAAYRAACTPDFFVFDADGWLAYRGQFDGSRPSNDVPVTGEDLRGAIEALLAGHPASEEQRPSMGCSIKWRPGNEPR